MKYLTIICLVSILLVSQACSAETSDTQALPSNEINQNEDRRVAKGQTNKTSTQSELQPVQADETSIKNTKGLIVLSDRYGKKDFIRFYNADGSLWYEFSFYYEQIGDRTFPENENFRAFSFHRDYFVLALKCVGEDKNRYEVIVNEENGLKKFVKKDDPTLKFETWEKHILKLFAVGFDKEKNPLRETPEGQAKIVEVPKEIPVHPVEIKGDWLKVRWDDSKTSGKNGWVKWKDNYNLLIELFYFS